MKEFASSELENLKKTMRLMKKIKLFLLPKDQADTKNAIIEIRAGTGVLRPVFLLQIYFKCMKKLVKKRHGK